ncbi:ABC transporter substrate-binding protein [Streptomyces sp. NPDC015661]|uniref:ABC transporter substrate-binding protein n=1 Tax=Streptomyces sp. NPDC015661 TaxID=3364961 RepID=UPI0037028A61
MKNEVSVLSRLNVALDSMPLAGDYHWPIDYDSRLVGGALVRTLFSESGEPAEPAPGAAGKAWTLDDGRTWRVRLDERRRWSDGEPLRAAHAEAAVARILARPGSMAARLLDRDAGAVRAVDGATLDYRFAQPTSFAREVLTLPQFAPFRVAVDGRKVSLGSYEEVDGGAHEIRLARHDFADDTGTGPAPGQLVFTRPGSHGDALDAYGNGAVDITPTTGFGQEQLDRFADHPRLVGRDVSMFGSLEFGTLATRFSQSPDARRALSRLLDRGRLVGRVPGLLKPWSQRVDLWRCASPVRGGSTAEEGRPDDRELSLLREAVKGDRVITYADFPPNGEIVAGIRDQLGEALGIEVAIRPVAFPAYVRTVVSGNYDMLYTLTTADFPHIAALLTPWHSRGVAGARTGLCDPVLDRLLDRARACLDPAAAGTEWDRAGERWLDLMPRIPLVQVRVNCVYSEKVRELEISGAGFFDFDRMSTNCAE